MKCNSCSKEFTDNWNTFCIKNTKRCISCQKSWEEKPENDPDYKKFLVTYKYYSEDEAVVYAKNEKDAAEQFEDNFSGEFNEYSIEEVKK